MFALIKLRADDIGCKKIDAQRFKKYYGYMLKQHKDSTLESLIEHCFAPIEHLFNDHSLCDPKWCKPLRFSSQTDSNGMIIDSSLHGIHNLSYYRCKVKHKKLYDEMTSAFLPYSFPHRLVESLHGFTTNGNEALNNIVAHYAPKNRTYSTTMSLSNRISIVVGVHNIGYLDYWTDAYEKIQLPMTVAQRKLHSKDRRRNWKREYNSMIETKRKRSQKRNESMRDLMKQQQEDAKRGAIYESGYALEDHVPDKVKDIENALRLEGKVSCKIFGCHGNTHKTKASKNCRYHSCKDSWEIREKQHSILREIYPDHF